MKCTYEAIISLAKAELGYCEKETNNNLDDKTANAGNKNWNKYAHYIDETFPTFYNSRKNGYAWCDVFVDYLFLRSFGLDLALKCLYQPLKSGGASCTQSRAYYKAAGQYDKHPQVGAQIFFTNDGGKSCNHTGIVIKIDSVYVYTIEGNSGDKVSERSYRRDNSTIDGYGHPNYTGEEVNTVKTETEIAREVIAGLWGNGQDRVNRLTAAGYNPSNIQNIVNALVKGQPSSEKTEQENTLHIKVEKNKYEHIIIDIV